MQQRCLELEDCSHDGSDGELLRQFNRLVQHREELAGLRNGFRRDDVRQGLAVDLVVTQLLEEELRK